MKFNEKWTKEDNDLMRKMIAEGKKEDYIIEYFGMDKLSNHPTKYNKRVITKYDEFVNEIHISPQKVFYSPRMMKSKIDSSIYDYMIEFDSKGVTYVLLMIYYIYNGVESHVISFTTKTQYDLYNNYIDNIYNLRGEMTDTEISNSIDIFERTTNFNNLYSVMRNISFVLLDFTNSRNINNSHIISITEGNDSRRIDLYRSIINDSFKNIIETEDILENGRKIYFFQM